MRTLKKTLALVLVLAMMFSLCITASADFTDAEEITNAKAVATLVGLGVIDGMPDGTFAPEGTLTRAQAAKIVAYLHGVGEYAADGAETGFTDVPASHWASGYIAYCADAGIIDGYGDGKFGPSDTLTGYAWTKMLLCALGYDADIEGYTGSAWQIAVAKDAVALKIWKGAEADNKAALTRDNACLYGYNVLNLTVKTMGDKGYGPDGGKFVETNLLTKVEEGNTADKYGRPMIAVTGTDLTKEDAKPVTYYTEAATPVLTYTAGVKAATIKKDLGNDKANIGTFTEAGKGTLVEVFATATKDVYFVNVIEEAVDVIAKTDIDTRNGKVVIGGVSVEETGLVEGDVVVYTKTDSGKEIEYYKAESVTGTVTSVSSQGYFYLDGTAMDYAAGKGDVSVIVTGAEEITVYTDKYGYVVYAAEAEEDKDEEKATVLYGYVTDYDSQEPKDADNSLIAPEAAVAAAEKVEIVTAAGETVVYDVAYTVDKDGKFVSFLADESVIGCLVSYTLDKDGKVATIEAAGVAAGKHSYTTGNAYLNNDTGSTRFTATTIAFVDCGEKDGVKVYTGYQSIPSFEAAYQRIIDKGAFVAIAIDKADLTTDAPIVEKDYAYVASTAYETAAVKGEDGKSVTVYKYADIYVDGVKTTLTFANTISANVGLYEYEVDTKTGIATLGDAVTDKAAEITAQEATYFKADAVYYVDDTTIYYEITKGASVTVAAVEALPEAKAGYRTVLNYAYDGADEGTKLDVVYFEVINLYPNQPATRAEAMAPFANFAGFEKWGELPSLGLAQELDKDTLYVSGKLTAINEENYADYKAACEQWLSGEAADFDAFIAALAAQGFDLADVEEIAFVLLDTADYAVAVTCVVNDDGAVRCLKNAGNTLNYAGITWDFSGLSF